MFPSMEGIALTVKEPSGEEVVSVAGSVVPGVLLARVVDCVPVWCCAFPLSKENVEVLELGRRDGTCLFGAFGGIATSSKTP